jgi:hypothetical protein
VHLVQRLQVLHARCSYAEMLHHYCPVSSYGMAIRALCTYPSRYPDKLVARGKPWRSRVGLCRPLPSRQQSLRGAEKSQSRQLHLSQTSNTPLSPSSLLPFPAFPPFAGACCQKSYQMSFGVRVPLRSTTKHAS